MLLAIANLFPAAEHRYCVRHIHENLNLTWRGSEYKEMLRKCAKALTKPEFNRHMDELKGYNKKCYDWLKKIEPEHWSRSHFSGMILFTVICALCVLYFCNMCPLIYVSI